jgi:Fe-S-cluster containining protein
MAIAPNIWGIGAVAGAAACLTTVNTPRSLGSGIALVKDVANTCGLRLVSAESDKDGSGLTENKPLDCLRCPSFCCKLAGYVQVSRADIRRLAKHLQLTVREFEARHIVKITRKREKLIKAMDETCQFLGPDRRCTVYSARPRDCRGYVCWDQDDSTVFDFAQFALNRVRKKRSAGKAR